MAELNEVQTSCKSSLWRYTDSGAYAALRAAPVATAAPADTPPPFFSEFITDHLEEAISLAERFMQIADTTPGPNGPMQW